MKTMTISTIMDLIDHRKAEVIKLQKRRSFYEKRLKQVISRIEKISGGVVVRSRRKKRVKNEQALHVVVSHLLSKKKRGYTLADLTNKVIDTGHKSHSKNFRNVVYQCLYHMQGMQYDPNTGLYSLQ